MKCGTQIKEGQVFCDDCLALMRQFPVKPDTYVQLPSRPAAPTKKPAPRKKVIPPEVQIAKLRKTIRWLVFSLVCMAAALGIAINLLVHTGTQDDAGRGIGKNYSTIDTGSKPG